MERVHDQESDRKDVALKTLAWISYAFRSLSLRELQHAVAIQHQETDLDEELVMDGASITAVCAGLVVIDQRTNLVNLVHYTTKNYFEQIRSVLFPNFHATITLNCATYLTFEALKDANIWKILQNFPLAGYAAQYMTYHARQNPEDTLEPFILEILCQLLSHPGKRKPLLALLDSQDMIKSGFYNFAEVPSSTNDDTELDQSAEIQLDSLLDSITETSETTSQAMTEIGESEANFRETQVNLGRIPEVTALHLAASMGLAKVAAMLLKDTSNIDAVDETGNTALAVAMERGFEKAVEFLVNSGVCVDLTQHRGQEMLLLVAERDWDSVAQVIADKANVEPLEVVPSAAQNQTQLLLAAYYGDDK